MATPTPPGPARLLVVDDETVPRLIVARAAERLGIDLARVAADKIVVNDAKYPVAKSRGNARKYNEL